MSIDTDPQHQTAAPLLVVVVVRSFLRYRIPMSSRLELPSPAAVVVLNGTSSSGKSTLAKAMQAVWPSPTHHIQLDAFRDIDPPGYWSGWQSLQKDKTALMMGALCGAMFAAVVQYSRHGQAVVLDVALTNPQARQMLVENLSRLPVHIVGVHCDEIELARREARRGDREIGLAVSQIGWLHKQMLYDFEVNTTLEAPENCAAELLSWFATSPRPSALNRLHARLNAANPSIESA